MTLTFSWLFLLAIIILIGWLINRNRGDYVPPADAEKPLSAREALRFGIDNDLPLKPQTVHYIQPREGKEI